MRHLEPSPASLLKSCFLPAPPGREEVLGVTDLCMFSSHKCAWGCVQVPEHEQGCSSGGLQDQAPNLEGDDEQPADVSAPEEAHEGVPPHAQLAADGGNAQQKRVDAPEHLEQAASLKVRPIRLAWLSIFACHSVCGRHTCIHRPLECRLLWHDSTICYTVCCMQELVVRLYPSVT